MTFSHVAALIAFIAAANSSPLDARASTPISSITTAQWNSLNQTVGGRLYQGAPIAKPCFTFYNGAQSNPDLAQCKAVQDGYVDEVSIANNYGGFVNTNWATCQAKAQGCGLNYNQPLDPTYYAPPKNCFQGSVPTYYIDVRQVSDVQAALRFADSTGVPLVIKNSGHDYKGRSSGANALGLWTHNVQPPIKLTRGFTPEGCSSPAGDAVTLGAGQGWGGVYEFAEANNITVVGGSSRTVGPVGGWISGGGHGALSNTLGLGVDNVMEIKTVLPNGTYVTANRCQNQDLFFALRGGGGSTFGVNMEMTTRAHPQLNLEVAYIRFLTTDPDSISKFVKLCTENGDKWAADGWGGYIAPGAQGVLASGMILMTPKLSHAEAVASMKPITDYVAGLRNQPLNNEVNSETSFYQAYQKYIGPNQEKVGLGVAIGSRLIPRNLLQNTAGQQSVAAAIEKALSMVVPPTTNQLDARALTYGPPFQILVTTPSNYDTDGTSSLTPAWYGENGAVWHAVLGQGFANDADAQTIQTAFKTAHDAAQVLRDVAPNSGAYQNEADVFEPDPVGTYWGQANYDKLLALKKGLDPKNLLTCWGCIGWDKTDSRFGCYPSI